MSLGAMTLVVAETTTKSSNGGTLEVVAGRVQQPNHGAAGLRKPLMARYELNSTYLPMKLKQCLKFHA